MHVQPNEKTLLDDEEQTRVETEGIGSPPGLARELGFGAVVARETHGDEVVSEWVEAPAEEGEEGNVLPEG